MHDYQSQPDKSTDGPNRHFGYDRVTPLAAEEHALDTTPQGYVQEISYAGAGDQRLNASLVLPDGAGPFPAVVYLHPAPGDRFTYQEEAGLLAQRRIAAFLVEAPWAQPESFFSVMADPDQARDLIAQFVIGLRRGIDYLQTRPEIDGQRIALVGHSLGAVVAGVLAGVEPRLRAIVLIAGTGSFTDLVKLNMPDLQGPALEQYAQTMDPIDPIHFIARAAPRPLLYQFGEADDFYSQNTFDHFAQAGSQPKSVRWYATDHAFASPEAQDDRLKWLATHLSAASSG